MRRPDTYSVSVGPAAYEYAKRVAEQTMRDNAKLGLTFEELAVALVLRGVALSAQAEPQPEWIPCSKFSMACDKPADCKAHPLGCRFDEPPKQPALDVAALVERLNALADDIDCDAADNRSLLLNAAEALTAQQDRLTALAAERDEQHRLAVKRWDDMCAYADRTTAAESALAAAPADEGLLLLVEDAASMLRGMLMDPAIPEHAKAAMLDRIADLEQAVEDRLP